MWIISFSSGIISLNDLIWPYWFASLDLVPVSSTVIPESDLPNQDEITAEMDKEYKKAYFSLFKKKFNTKFEKPDTLMTDKKKYTKSSTRKPEWKFKSLKLIVLTDVYSIFYVEN